MRITYRRSHCVSDKRRAGAKTGPIWRTPVWEHNNAVGGKSEGDPFDPVFGADEAVISDDEIDGMTYKMDGYSVFLVIKSWNTGRSPSTTTGCSPPTATDRLQRESWQFKCH